MSALDQLRATLGAQQAVPLAVRHSLEFCDGDLLNAVVSWLLSPDRPSAADGDDLLLWLRIAECIQNVPATPSLQPLLEVATSLPFRVEGLREAVRVAAGLGAIASSKDCSSMELRKDLVAALRTHLGNARVDPVFEFSGSNAGALALPPMAWSSFRGYTVVLWFQASFVPPGPAPVVGSLLYRFRSTSGQGIEARLSGVMPGGGSSRMLTVTTFPKNGGTPKSVHCALNGLDGRWRLLTVSHTLPYVKRSMVRVSLDGEQVLHAELAYPVGGGSAAADFRSRPSLCEGFVGKLAAAAMYEEEMPLHVAAALARLGPGYLPFACALPVPRVSSSLHTAASKGLATAAGTTQRLLWAYLPQHAHGAKVMPWKPLGFMRLWDVAVLPPAASSGLSAAAAAGAPGNAAYASLEGGARVASQYTTAEGTVQEGQGGISNIWFAAGGVRALLYAASCVADSAAAAAHREAGKRSAGQGPIPLAIIAASSTLLAEMLRLLTELLLAGHVHREEFLQIHGFHMVSIILQRLPEPAASLDPELLGACLKLAQAMEVCGESELLGAALQGLLLDFRLWSEASPLVQAVLLQGVAQLSTGKARHARTYIGVQLLLDALRVHITAREVSSKTGTSDGDAESLISSVEACENLLVAMVESGMSGGIVDNGDLPSPDGGETGSQQHRIVAAPSPAQRVHEQPAPDVHCLVMCLHECQSYTLWRSLLSVLLRLRCAHPNALRKELFKSGFATATAPALLTKKGYPLDVRRDCLGLAMWLLLEVDTYAEHVSLVVHQRKHTGAVGPRPGSPVQPQLSSSPPDGHASTESVEVRAGRPPQRVAQSPGALDDDPLNAVLADLASRDPMFLHVELARAIAVSVAAGNWGKIGKETIDVALGRERGAWPVGEPPCWLSLPFLAALLPFAASQDREGAIMAATISLKSDFEAQRQLMERSKPSWSACLLELALCSHVAANVQGVMPQGGAFAAGGGEGDGGSGEGSWESVYHFGSEAVSTSAVAAASVCEELALDALGCCVAESLSRLSGGDLLQRVVRDVDMAVTCGRVQPSWSRDVLCRLASVVLRRRLRNGHPWTLHTHDLLTPSLLALLERLLPAHPSNAELHMGPAQWHLMECLFDTSKLLRGLLASTRPADAGAAGQVGDESVRLRAEKLLRQLLRVILRGLALHGASVDQIRTLSQEFGSILQTLLSAQPPSPASTTAAGREVTLMAVAALGRALDACAVATGPDASSSSVMAAVERREFLGAVVMGLLQDLIHVPDAKAPGAPATPARFAAAELLAPASECPDVDSVFAALRDALAEAAAESATYDFVEDSVWFSGNAENEVSLSLAPTALDRAPVAPGANGGARLGNLLLGWGGAPAVEAWLAQRLALHGERVEVERLRMAHAMAGLDVAAERGRRHWKRISRLAEAEGGMTGVAASEADPRRLTRWHYNADWKLAGGAHEGREPARLRVVLTPKVSGSSRSTGSGGNASRRAVAGSESDTQRLGTELARKISRYIVDITKSEEADRDQETEGEGEDVDMLGREPWGVVDELPEATDLVVTEVTAGGQEVTARVSKAEREEREEEMVRAAHELLMGSVGTAEGVAAGHSAGPEVDMGPGTLEVAAAAAAAAPLPRGAAAATMVMPKGNVAGYLYIARSALVFVPRGENDASSEAAQSDSGGVVSRNSRPKGRAWSLGHICAIYSRRFRLCDSALEIFLRQGKRRSVFVDFGSSVEDVDRRDEFRRSLAKLCPRADKHWPSEAQRLQQAWQARRISNFDYIMGLNTLGGRSFNDLCQYPVFPWVIADYSRETFDLDDPTFLRDLSKPMGALNEARLREFMERYESFQDPDIPAFMYGSHYSTAVGVVLHYLVRLQPYADLHRQMQNGNFDVADRLFSSIPRAWEMCTSALSEVKELTPEWYSLPDFLRNASNLNLGKTQDGEVVGDVVLPKWANSPEDFIHKQRQALESDAVSRHLHLWVDLIFGKKQRGQAAKDAHNVFYYLTYYGAVDLAAITDPALRRATELQIAHFGQCPLQIFNRAHPPRGERIGVPRPLALALSGLEEWKDAASHDRQVETQFIVMPLGDSGGGIRCTSLLGDGTLLTVNCRGVIEVCRYSWRDGASSFHDMDSSGPGGDAPPLQDSSTRSSRSRSSSRHAGGGGGGGGGSERDRAGPSGVFVERMDVPFDVVPRVQLGSPSAPLLFSATGRYLFGGGDPCGDILIWQIDPKTGQITGEASIHAHTGAVTCLAACYVEAAGHEIILSGSADGTAAIWLLRKVGLTFRRPVANRRPMRVLRGHSGPVTCCAVDDSLGIALTCSKGRALIHSLESDLMIRNLVAADSGDGLLANAVATKCALSELGYAVLSTTSCEEGGGSVLSSLTLNGRLVARVAAAGGVRTMSSAGRGRFVVIGGENLLVEVRSVTDLCPLWVMPTASLAAAGTLSTAAPLLCPAVECIQLGPVPDAPILAVVGLGDGRLVVQALPDAEYWLRTNILTAVGSLVTAPFKVAKETALGVHSIALNAARNVGGMVQTGHGIASELVGEGKTLVKGMQRVGLVRGIIGYMKGDTAAAGSPPSQQEPPPPPSAPRPL